MKKKHKEGKKNLGKAFIFFILWRFLLLWRFFADILRIMEKRSGWRGQSKDYAKWYSLWIKNNINI